jgi:hypothetical protein
MPRKAILISLFVLLVILIGANMSYGATGDMKRGIGIRAGYGVNPDQFIVGGQAIWGALKGKVDFSPSLDFGFGDNATVTTINFDGTLNLVSAPGAKMKFYIGAGPTIAIINPEFGDGDTEIGLSLLGGIKIGAGEKNFYNISARFGIGDIPDFKFLFGYMFGLGSKGK